MEVIDIAACTDRHYVMPTGVMMQSVCVNNPGVDIVFHVVVDEDVTDGDRRALEDVTDPFDGKSVVFYPVSEEIAKTNYPALGNRYSITRATYYRLWLDDILPEAVRRVLYLDGDVIVRKSLLPLWNKCLNGYPIAAVPIDYQKAANDFCSRLDDSPQLGYFNAGVLLVNLEEWRNRNIAKDFRGCIKHLAADIMYHDQDVLNYVFMKEKCLLPLRYNMQTGFYFRDPLYDRKYEEEVRASLRDPVIIHYTGVSPWERYNRYPHPLKSSFLRYQDMTRWRGVTYERRPLKLRMINLGADLLRKCRLRPQLADVFMDIDPID